MKKSKDQSNEKLSYEQSNQSIPSDSENVIPQISPKIEHITFDFQDIDDPISSDSDDYLDYNYNYEDLPKTPDLNEADIENTPVQHLSNEDVTSYLEKDSPHSKNILVKWKGVFNKKKIEPEINVSEGAPENPDISQLKILPTNLMPAANQPTYRELSGDLDLVKPYMEYKGLNLSNLDKLLDKTTAEDDSVSLKIIPTNKPSKDTKPIPIISDSVLEKLSYAPEEGMAREEDTINVSNPSTPPKLNAPQHEKDWKTFAMDLVNQEKVEKANEAHRKEVISKELLAKKKKGKEKSHLKHFPKMLQTFLSSATPSLYGLAYLPFLLFFIGTIVLWNFVLKNRVFGLPYQFFIYSTYTIVVACFAFFLPSILIYLRRPMDFVFNLTKKKLAPSNIIGFMLISLPATFFLQGFNNILTYYMIKTDIFVTTTPLPNPIFLYNSVTSFGEKAFMVVLFALLPSILEELFFRGILQSTLLQSKSVKKAIFLQAIAFALTQNTDLFWFSPVLIGLLMGHLRQITNTLWAPIIARLTLTLTTLFIQPILPTFIYHSITIGTEKGLLNLYASFLSLVLSFFILILVLKTVRKIHFADKPQKDFLSIKLIPKPTSLYFLISLAFIFISRFIFFK